MPDTGKEVGDQCIYRAGAFDLQPVPGAAEHVQVGVRQQGRHADAVLGRYYAVLPAVQKHHRRGDGGKVAFGKAGPGGREAREDALHGLVRSRPGAGLVAQADGFGRHQRRVGDEAFAQQSLHPLHAGGVGT